ncbi:MAG: phosphate/phosphite/phosphonate ABC transporter substrate-binding protein [Opitutales bacterium]|nr:phosphate/phosphite/phosphonate ABC transporter substrate-binding protein [Opitutales bacterium]
MKSILKKLLLSAVATLVALSAIANDPDPSVLRVALLPDENASTVIKNNEPLKKHLEHETGKRIELVVTTDYSSMIEAMRRGHIEMGYFGPLSYVMAKERSPQIEAFAAQVKDGSPTYRGIIIGSAKHGINEIHKIKGKTMVFGDHASTSSHLIPKTILKQYGYEVSTDYSEQFVGTHDAVALAVANGKAEMGGLSEPIFLRLVEKGIINPKDVVVITYSDQFPNYPWTMQGYLAEPLKEKIRNAMIGLKDKRVLESFKADGFAPICDHDYQKIRDMGAILGLDFSKL